MSTDSTEEKSRSRTPLDLDYTDVEPLSRFVTDTGKILPRRITGLTALQQRHVTRAIKRARNMLLMK
jgi:small subunit ribosomal protein S18